MKRTHTEKIPHTKSSGSVDVPERLRAMDRKQRHAVLATDAGGRPYTSLVAFALTPDARGILFATPKNTVKYRNILRNSNISLMVDTRSNTRKGYMNAEAIAVLGTAAPVRKGRRRDAYREVFIKKHPALSEFLGAPSTALVYMTITKALHAGRFQTVSEWVPAVSSRYSACRRGGS